MLAKCLLIILLNTIQNSLSINANVVIHKNELTEAQKDQALGIGLSELQNASDLDVVADKLITFFSHSYGGKWYCTILSGAFAAKFDSQPNSLIWFSLGSTHVILFRPGFMRPNDLIEESKHANPKISIVQSEMNAKMKNFALNISLVAIEAYNEFNLIAKNISESLDEEFGKYWHCVIGQKGVDANLRYINGSYINFIIEDLEIILFQTNQPQFKEDFYSILNEAKVSNAVVNNKTDPFMINDVIAIAKDALNQNTSSDDCYIDYETRNMSHSTSCYYKIAKFVKTKLYEKYKSGWSVTIGDPNYYSDSSINEKNYFDFYFGRLLFIVTQY